MVTPPKSPPRITILVFWDVGMSHLTDVPNFSGGDGAALADDWCRQCFRGCRLGEGKKQSLCQGGQVNNFRASGDQSVSLGRFLACSLGENV